MRAVVQRVSRAQVTVANEIVSKIGRGLLVLLGVTHADSGADADYLADKIAGLRTFEDEKGKMNLDTASVAGEILVVSQFTLYGDVRRGKRPSFDAAAPPERARQLYEYFVEDWTSLPDRPLPGNDAGRTSERWSGNDSAGFDQNVLGMLELRRERPRSCGAHQQTHDSYQDMA
jgi:D-tyrosyl-tRNA(Tyr) deacylase